MKMALEKQCKNGCSRAGLAVELWIDGGGIWMVVVVVQGTKDEIGVKRWIITSKFV